MAHATDYASRTTLSSRQILIERASHGRILVTRFLRDNPTWAIDSLVTYLLSTYKDYLVDHAMIADCMKDYINSRTPT